MISDGRDDVDNGCGGNDDDGSDDGGCVLHFSLLLLGDGVRAEKAMTE